MMRKHLEKCLLGGIAALSIVLVVQIAQVSRTIHQIRAGIPPSAAEQIEILGFDDLVVGQSKAEVSEALRGLRPRFMRASVDPQIREQYSAESEWIFTFLDVAAEDGEPRYAFVELYFDATDKLVLGRKLIPKR